MQQKVHAMRLGVVRVYEASRNTKKHHHKQVDALPF
jgi:hypothetical protein